MFFFQKIRFICKPYTTIKKYFIKAGIDFIFRLGIKGEN